MKELNFEKTRTESKADEYIYSFIELLESDVLRYKRQLDAEEEYDE